MANRGLLLSHLGHYGRRGFEIGALMSPFLSKFDSDIIYVDRLSTAELRQKYRDEPKVEADRILDVDVILGEENFREKMAGLGLFDYAIASHVIEHVPNVVGWLDDIAALMRVGGRLLLVVPDKRYTFDYLRETSTLSALIEAKLGNYRRPSPGQVFDFNAYAANVDKIAALDSDLDPAILKRYGGLLPAFELALKSQAEQAYLDSHCWVFTPASMLSHFADLAELKVLNFRLSFFADTQRHEEDFGLILERVPDDADWSSVAASFRSEALDVDRQKSTARLRKATCAAEHTPELSTQHQSAMTMMRQKLAKKLRRVWAIPG